MNCGICEKLSTHIDWCLTRHYDMQMHGGVDIDLQPFLTSELDEVEWSASSSCSFTP